MEFPVLSAVKLRGEQCFAQSLVYTVEILTRRFTQQAFLSANICGRALKNTSGVPCLCHQIVIGHLIRWCYKTSITLQSHLLYPKWYFEGFCSLPCSGFWQTDRCFFALAWSPERHIHLRLDGAKRGLGSSCLPTARWDSSREDTGRRCDLG